MDIYSSRHQQILFFSVRYKFSLSTGFINLSFFFFSPAVFFNISSNKYGYVLLDICQSFQNNINSELYSVVAILMDITRAVKED